MSVSKADSLALLSGTRTPLVRGELRRSPHVDTVRLGALAAFAAGALLFWWHFGISKISEALGLSAASTFGIFGFRKEFVDPNLLAMLRGPLSLVAGLQTVIGSVLLFLLGLALRNRLRMR